MISPRDSMLLIYIPAGEFIMGSREGEGQSDEHPQHTVYLDAYWIDRSEVTNSMFSQFVNETGYQTEAEKTGYSFVFQNGDLSQVSGANWKNPQGSGSSIDGLENHPVVHVTWYDAKSYCNWAGRQLPIEAQWEKAARGTLPVMFPWGDSNPGGNQGGIFANYADVNLDANWSNKTINDGYQFTAPVGSYTSGASSYGLLDMAGNVWEWTADYYDKTYYSSQSSWKNPTGPILGNIRVIRGGSWGSNDSNLRTADRSWPDPSNFNSGIGFRCAMIAE